MKSKPLLYILSVTATAEDYYGNKDYPKAAVILEKIAKTVIIHKKSSLSIYVDQMSFASSVSIVC